MLKMGDEYGHTSKGNNNPYVQDNEISWFLWDECNKHQEIYEFTSSLIAFRKELLCFKNERFPTEQDIDWHGAEPFHPNWGHHNRFVAFTLKGTSPVYVAFNADHQKRRVSLPSGCIWKEVVNTANDWSSHHLRFPDRGKEVVSIDLLPHSTYLAKGVA